MEPSQDHNQSCPCSSFDLAFGFDDPAFSDRILKLLIFDDGTLEEKSNNESGEDCNSNDLLKSLKTWKEDIPESKKDFRVKNLNICSLILAAKSPFFRKLFTNGMKETNQNEVTLSIHSSEEGAIMDVIRFIYGKKLLSANTQKALVEVLVAANKYDVPSCVNYCRARLLSLSMNAELAFFYIDLSSIISMDAIQPLLNLALPIILKDVSKYHQHIIKLSLDGIKLILLSDDLEVSSENEAYDLLIKWSKEHFVDSKERCRVLRAEIFDLIRLQHMTPLKLISVLHELCDENNQIDVGFVSSMIEAFLDDSKPSLSRRSYKKPPVVSAAETDFYPWFEEFDII